MTMDYFEKNGTENMETVGGEKAFAGENAFDEAAVDTGVTDLGTEETGSGGDHAMDSEEQLRDSGDETVGSEQEVDARDGRESDSGEDASTVNEPEDGAKTAAARKKRSSRKKTDTVQVVGEPSDVLPESDVSTVLMDTELHGESDGALLPSLDDALDASGEDMARAGEDLLVMELASDADVSGGPVAEDEQDQPGTKQMEGEESHEEDTLPEEDAITGDGADDPAVNRDRSLIPAADAAPTARAARGPRPKENRPVSGHMPLASLNLNELDRYLSREERQEWNDIYASFRSKSVLTGKIIGIDSNSFYVRNKETGALERRRMYCAVVIAYRVKVLIPETEFWMPGEERPAHVLRNMTGAEIDYTVLDVDREGGVAIASRRMGMTSRRHYFSTARGGHTNGERLTCRVMAVGPTRCLLECGGFDVTLNRRDMTYTSMYDLREKYRPGQSLDCVLTGYDRAAGQLKISVREAEPNPFQGIASRHPLGSRRQAVISGKYGGGVFCTLPDGTTCLCLYTAQHTDRDFHVGDTVLLVIVQFDEPRSLVYGRILSKW